MSDLYEVGFVLELRDDLPKEIYETLIYMTRTGKVSAAPSHLNHPFFHVEGYETEWMDLIANSRSNDEEMLGKSCGSVLTDDQLAFRGLFHEDPFWNTWREFIDWLSLISFPTGLIGYYRNISYDDEVTLVSFEAEDVFETKCENYLEFEELKNQIIETIENS